jgi:radical SAM protein with 4Fe4S-binding SPASM domain
MAEMFIDGSKLIHHLDEVNQWKKGELVFPLHVEISPTSGCNQRCNLCCVDYLGHKSKMLSEDILVNLVDQMKDNGVKSVLLAGEGEPTANRAIMPMVERAKEIGLDFAINSNAVLIDDEMARRILPGLTWARFTLQAADRDIYNEIHKGSPRDYDKAMENIANMVKVKKELGLDVTLGIQQILINENYNNIFDTAKKAKELGVDYFVIKRFSKHPKNTYDVPEDLWMQATEQLKQVETLTDENFNSIVRWNNFEKDPNRQYSNCIGISFITQILADGGIYPCSQFFYDPNYCYGNLNDNTFEEIFNSDKRKEVQKHIETKINVSKCMTFCRHHCTNQFLSTVIKTPKHENFI